MAAPAAVAEYPWTWIRFNGNKKKEIPIAAYRKRVNRFAALKRRDSKSVGGTIGEETWASTKTNAIRHPKPTIKLPSTRGFLQPRLSDSSKPFTNPPSATG